LIFYLFLEFYTLDKLKLFKFLIMLIVNKSLMLMQYEKYKEVLNIKYIYEDNPTKLNLVFILNN